MVDSQQEWMNCSSPIPGMFVRIRFLQPCAEFVVKLAELDVHGDYWTSHIATNYFKLN